MPQSDDIGRIGQSIVSTWASQVGATPNPSYHDDRGWDILLQFHSSAPDRNVGPLDRAAPQSTCMVQVKTTTKSRRTWGIKLSNWQHMELGILKQVINAPDYQAAIGLLSVPRLDSKFPD